MNELLLIEIANRRERFFLDEATLLRVVFTRPPTSSVAAIIPANSVRYHGARLETDLLMQDIRLNPGDRFTLSLNVRFTEVGDSNFDRFSIQVNPATNNETDRAIQRFPSYPFQVVPSLSRTLASKIERVCSYDDAVKVELCLTNQHSSEIRDIEWTCENPERIRVGPLRRTFSRLGPGEETRFDLVVTADEVRFRLDATIDGNPVEQLRLLPVPTSSTIKNDFRPAFVFLEPRALTTDRIVIARDATAEVPVSATNGVFRVQGGKQRYILTVFPSHPSATGVKLYPARGQIEIEPLESKAGQWGFLLTVVDNPTLAQLVRLDYDVQVPGIPQRGELYLSIQPTSFKHWSIAITAGFAVTLKGAAGLVPVLFRDQPEWDSIWEGLQQNWLDVMQLVSIFLIYGGLAVANYLWTNTVES
jgi:hypothetical protein